MTDRLLTRRRFLTASAVGATPLAANACWVEPGRLQITDHVIGDPVPSGVPLRVVQLSDLHLQRVGRHEERIAAATHRLEPDVVVLSGDVIDRSDRMATLRSFLPLLPRNTLTFAIPGNWEHWAGVNLLELERVYQACGVRLLVNQTVRLDHNGVPLLVTGMDDSTGGHPDARHPKLEHGLITHGRVLSTGTAGRKSRSTKGRAMRTSLLMILLTGVSVSPSFGMVLTAAGTPLPSPAHRQLSAAPDSILHDLQGYAFQVRHSPALAGKARVMADRVASVLDLFGPRLGIRPEVTLLVLAPEHWADHTSFPVYGMPHILGEGTLVVAGEDNSFWQGLLPEPTSLPGEAAAALRRVYDDGTGGVSAAAFVTFLDDHVHGHRRQCGGLHRLQSQ